MFATVSTNICGSFISGIAKSRFLRKETVAYGVSQHVTSVDVSIKDLSLAAARAAVKIRRSPRRGVTHFAKVIR